MSDLDRTIRFNVNLGRAIITETKSVNNQEPDESGNISLNATHIPVSGDENAQSVSEALEALQEITADDVSYTPPGAEQEATTVKDELDALRTDMTATEIDEMFEAVFGGGE